MALGLNLLLRSIRVQNQLGKLPALTSGLKQLLRFYSQQLPNGYPSPSSSHVGGQMLSSSHPLLQNLKFYSLSSNPDEKQSSPQGTSSESEENVHLEENTSTPTTKTENPPPGSGRLSADSSDSVNAKGGGDKVIHLRGLPWSATHEDVVKFFDGIEILNGSGGVHLVLTRNGRQSGEAYVELANQDDIEKAKKKHNEYIGNRYIEVFQKKRSEMMWVTKRASSELGHEDECCVHLKGLPYTCAEEEITQFFSGLEIAPYGIALPTTYYGHPTGEAFVQFVDKETAQKAMEKHKQEIGNRYIEIFKSNVTEIKYAMSPKMRGFNEDSPFASRDQFGEPNTYNMSRGRGGRNFNQRYNNDYNDGNNVSGNFGGRWGGQMGGVGLQGDTGHRVNMRGLPFSAQEYDIVEFFRPLKPVNIRFQMDTQNRPNGIAYVDFATHDDALMAMNKDKSYIQHRYIDLFLKSSPSSGGMDGGSGGVIGGGGGPMRGPMGSPMNPMGGGRGFGGGCGRNCDFGGGSGGDGRGEGARLNVMAAPIWV